MKAIKQIRIEKEISVEELTVEYSKVGVLGAKRLSNTHKILVKIFSDKNFFNILAISGPLVPAGLRLIFRNLIQKKLVHCIVSTGANVTHDLVEAFGFRHKIGSLEENDDVLKERKIGRIYDIFIQEKAFEELEKNIHKILDEIPENKRENLSTYDLLWIIGSHLRDDKSILKTAYRMRVPVLCPAIYDSMLGINLWTYSQLRKLVLNPFLDFSKIVDLCYEAKKVGAIILGGGLPKHYTLISNIFRGGVDAAIQITNDRPESGGLSGAPLEEAISWGKVKHRKNLVTLIGDASILFPMAIASVINKI